MSSIEDLAAHRDPLPPYSEEALALKFSAQHAHDLRYVDALSKWFRYDDRRHVWLSDNIRTIWLLVRELCRHAAAVCRSDSDRTRIASKKTVAAVEHLARCDPRHAHTVDDFDVDPWLLNTPDGVVDLRSADCQEHDRTQNHTKILSYGG